MMAQRPKMQARDAYPGASSYLTLAHAVECEFTNSAD